MRRLAQVFLIAFLTLVLTAVAGRADTQAQSSEMDIKLQEWCMGYFRERDRSKHFRSRPVQELAQLEMKEMSVVPDLVTTTQEDDRPPSEIRNYRGIWIWPSAGLSSPHAAFVEHLSPTEMTIAILTSRNARKLDLNTKERRLEFRWTGTEFQETKSSSKGSPELVAYVSPSGDALVLVEKPNSPDSTKTACFISDKITWRLPKPVTSYVNPIDERLFEWCLSHFPEPDEAAAPIKRPATLPPFTMEGVRAPPDLVKETVIVGKVPEAIKAYSGFWLLPWIDKSPFPYAAYVERLTPTEMTIAFLVKPLSDEPGMGLRHTLTWNGMGFAGKTMGGGLTLGVGISPSGEAMGISFANDREAHILGCLISSRHY